MPKLLIGLNIIEFYAAIRRLGAPAYRGKQLAEWIYLRNARTFEEMINLPIELRSKLSQEYEIGRSSTLAEQRSKDGTIKLLLQLNQESHPHPDPLPSRELCPIIN